MEPLSKPMVFLILVWSLGIAGPCIADDPTSKRKGRPTNRLARETSPYLLMHAHNPVDWYPWGDEAFAKAKKENKLVFLSIGYSSCYWCHVMERESFADPGVAKILNEGFVCIKVDREERPDIDAIYMTALNALRQRGGWPLSMFLTSDGKPIVGGTYWPREDREIEGQKVRGFKSILKFMIDWNAQKPDEVQGQADKLAELTNDLLSGYLRGNPLVDLDRPLVAGVVDGLKSEFDKVYGGFGSPDRDFRGTKFPVPPSLELLLHEAARSKSEEIAGMIHLTLDRMARGGIYDQLGGGFHRYSTERTWTVPHFEKMLYDNAQLLEVYARAYQLKPDALYRRIVKETMAFLRREMTSPEGAFYSALDAETEGEEGRFYVWTGKEIEDAVANKADADLVRKVYGLDAGANFEGKFHIFVLPRPAPETAKAVGLTEEQLDARLAPVREKLFNVRSKRPRPSLDTKILTGWNGQMIAGLAVAGQVFKEPAYVETGIRAAEFILSRLRTKDGRLLRSFGAQPGKTGEAKINAYLDDYAYLVHGLLCLHDATVDNRWLDEAKSLTDTMVQYHRDPKTGGFFFTSSDHEKLFARVKDQYDSVQPSGNSQAAMNLVRLWTKTGDQRYRDLAEQTFKVFAGALKANPTGLTAMAHGVALYLDAQENKSSTAQAPKELGQGGGAKKSDSVVKVKATATKPNAEGREIVTLTITIDEGWHLYANPVPKDFPGIPVTVTVEGKAKPKNAEIEYPKGKLVKDELAGNHHIYEGTIEIKATVTRAKDDASPLEFSLKLQACNQAKCLLPGVVKVMAEGTK
jgi:uncharacterized protein YyaL (SSP411 family)